MFAQFLAALREEGVPVSIGEYLAFLRSLQALGPILGLDDLHTIGRFSLVKDERLFDRYDRVFGRLFGGIVAGAPAERAIPPEWLEALARRVLSEEERAAIETLGGLDALMKTLAERLAEQKERHSGGNRWIGTGGTSPFGHAGYHPEGVRIGGQSEHRRAAKVWEQRSYRDLDDEAELGTRGMKIALRRLRRFARAGAARELDLDRTVRATAANAGLLDLRMRPERHNVMRLVILFDIGGSMDDFVRASEQLFTAVRSEFRHLAFFYFHNCPYEQVWTENRRRQATQRSTLELIRTFGPEHRLLFVGDATMGPYEITHAGGSVEHMNAEPGAVWMRRLLAHFPHAAWINPVPRDHWDFVASISMMRELMEDRMFPLTLGGLEQTVRALIR